MTDYALEQTIDKLSKLYNYFEGKKAIKIIESLTEEEAQIVLNNKEVQETIFKIDDVDKLREIFRKAPAFFQEIMFSNERIQDILISPKRGLTRHELITNYNKKDFVFNDKELRELEVFFHNIKSPKIFEQIVESKFFQRIVPMIFEKQVNKNFFKGMDIEKLFYNIINDSEIYNTRKPRKRNILEVFNKVSSHILLPDDYQTVISDGTKFIKTKRWRSSEFERVHIDDRTLSLLTNPMLEELLEFSNIDNEYITNYLRQDILPKIQKQNYDFDKIFAHLKDGRWNSFNGIDYIYFNVIFEEIEKNSELKEKFINFIYSILCPNRNFNEIEEEMIKQVIFNKMRNTDITKEDYRNLFSSPDTLKTIFYLKFGKTSRRMDYLHGISSNQMIYLNVKHINQIIANLNIDNEDELSNLYAYAIKLYMVFGLERTLLILKGEYGSLNRYFFDNVSKLNVEKVQMVKEGKKYLPKISDDFIGFMFANPKDNHFKNMLKDSSNLLNKNWSYVYNNLDEITEKCHGVLTLKKLNVILRELSPERDLSDVTPNNFKLKENEILSDICLGNKTRKTNQEVYKMVLDIYGNMKKRIESSIPYVKGQAANGYTYEMMKLNDPIAFTLGYRANCCIRTNDIAHNHLLHATLCRNGRILIIYDKHGELAGFAPLKRNGELLIANSIECLHKQRNENAISAFSEAITDIVKTSEDSEKNPIRLVCIGREAYAKPNGKPFPVEIKTPTIFEKDDPTYSGTDQYHRRLDILYQNPQVNLNKLKLGNPEASYYDPRPVIKACDFRKNTPEEVEESLKRINSVRYENADIEELEDFSLCRRYGLEKCVYSDDWYVVTTYDGKVYGDYVKFDPRAEREYQIAFSEVVGMSYEKYRKEKGIEKKLVLNRRRFN